MIAEYRHEVYIMMTKPTERYLAHLDGSMPVVNPLDESTFLKLSCFGPIDIYNAQHVRALGSWSLWVTIYLSGQYLQLRQANRASA